MRRFHFDDPGFEAAFAAFIEERRDTPEDVGYLIESSVREKGVQG